MTSHARPPEECRLPVGLLLFVLLSLLAGYSQASAQTADFVHHQHFSDPATFPNNQYQVDVDWENEHARFVGQFEVVVPETTSAVIFDVPGSFQVGLQSSLELEAQLTGTLSFKGSIPEENLAFYSATLTGSMGMAQTTFSVQEEENFTAGPNDRDIAISMQLEPSVDLLHWWIPIRSSFWLKTKYQSDGASKSLGSVSIDSYYNLPNRLSVAEVREFSAVRNKFPEDSGEIYVNWDATLDYAALSNFDSDGEEVRHVLEWRLEDENGNVLQRGKDNDRPSFGPWAFTQVSSTPMGELAGEWTNTFSPLAYAPDIEQVRLVAYLANSNSDYAFDSSHPDWPYGPDDEAIIKRVVVATHTFEADEPIQVDALGDEDDGDYSEGEQTLREALKRAGEENKRVDIPINVQGTIKLEHGELTIDGPNANQIALTTENGPVTIDAQAKSRILSLRQGQSLALEGITFRNGKVSSNGGAIHNEGDLTLLACVLSSNEVIEDGGLGRGGGALFNAEAATALLTGCIFDSNHVSGGDGGAILNRGRIDIWISGFFKNSASDSQFLADAGGDGGALYNGGEAMAEIINCEFQDNEAIRDDPGGGAMMNRGDVDLLECRVLDSVVNGGNLDVSDCLLTFIDTGGTTKIRDSLLVGWIEVTSSGDLEVVNSVIGSFMLNEGEARFLHCTMSEIFSRNRGRTEIGHCVVDETDSSGAGLNVSLGYNLVGRDSSSFTRKESDMVRPDLGISSNGTDLFISPFSPAVNAGDPSFDPNDFDPPLTTDFNGNPRVEGGQIDRGAVEVSAGTLALIEVLDQLVADKDQNKNGTPDLVDLLSGEDPTNGSIGSKPPIVVEAADSPQAIIAGIDVQALEGGDLTVRLRLDERVDFIQGTLQTSPDLLTWVDRATYLGQGAGEGILRTGENGALLLEEERSGYGWFLQESLQNTEGSLYARLKARVLGTSPEPVSTFPADGETLENVSTVSMEFEESLDPNSVTLETVTLTWAGADSQLDTADDEILTGGELTLSDDQTEIFLTFSEPLVEGHYRFTVSAQVRDAAGNPMAGSQTVEFDITEPKVEPPAVTGQTELTFDGEKVFSGENAYGNRVTSDQGGAYGGSGNFTPNVSLTYGPEEALPRVWGNGYGDLENVLYEEIDGFGRLELTFTADEGFLVTLHRWDMARWAGELEVPTVEVVDGEGNVLWSESDVLLPETHRRFDFSQSPLEAPQLTLRFDAGSLGGASDEVAFDNILFGQRPEGLPNDGGNGN